METQTPNEFREDEARGALGQTSAPAARRPLLFVLGLTFTALGTVGAALPLIPTTPFLLLAAACFARSSPRWHARLLESRIFGPYLRQWQHDHTVPRGAKLRAYALVLLTFGISISFTDKPGVRIFLIVLGVALLGFLAWLPVTRAESEGAGRGDGLG